MQSILDVLARQGYWVVFLTVLAEQLGMPIPAVPVLVAVGALAGFGKFSFTTCLLLAVAASLIADSVWFHLGRKRGQSVLRLLCKISLEPDSCVSLAKDWFKRLGKSALLIAKFIPGFSTAAPPMAGVNRMPYSRFLLLDAAGSALWAGLSLALGWFFRNQLEAVLDALSRLGSTLGIVIFGGLAAYIAFKWFQRYRFMQLLRATRITPEDLNARMQSGDEGIAVVDLRRPAEIQEAGSRIPGAIAFPVSDLESRHHEIPRDRDIILYCS